jgi:Tol biopolymer transport system component
LLLAGGFWYLSRPLAPSRITAYTQITHDGRDKQLAGTDGSRVYFTQVSPNVIAQVGIHGGEFAQLPIAIQGGEFVLLDISPDGSNALIEDLLPEGHSGPRLWVAPVLGGAAKRLEDGGLGTFFPDGASVIYSTADGDILTTRIDGTGKLKLANVGSWAWGFQWSPDGQAIRFSNQVGLWEMSTSGAGIHRLLSGWKGGVPCCGRWTQDGRLYVFAANGQIWGLDERSSLIRRPSSVPAQLTSGPIQWNAPIPGKDGKTIFAVGATQRGELSRADLRTGSPQPFLGGISAEFASFSPDGSSVAYVAFPQGTLWKTNRDGSNRLQLSRPTDYALNPQWSPNSREIVYNVESRDGHDSIRRVSAADGTALWLMSEESSDMHDANWSPDGEKVLFARSGAGGSRTGKRELCIVDLKTRQVTTLSGSDGMWSPRWSPDGRYIAAMTLPFQKSLPIFDVTAQQWHTLRVNGDVEFPAFSRDSRFIYFLRYGHDQGVYRIPVTGDKEQRVVDMTDWHLTGFLGFSMSLDPADAPLVLRDVGSDDIYALTLEEK